MKHIMTSLIGLLFLVGIFSSTAMATISDPSKDYDVNFKIASTYGDAIAKAANIFDIPTQIIVAVILTESDGDPWAVTDLSSAKGLMQTIDSTFAMAYKDLRSRDIQIRNNPFDPESSIMAGAWYLDRMYNEALKNNKVFVGSRQNLVNWRVPLEYYYAGPTNGRNRSNFIQVCSKGYCRTIDKKAYSSNALGFVNLPKQKSDFLAKASSQNGSNPILKQNRRLNHQNDTTDRKSFHAPNESFVDYRLSTDKGFD